MDGLIFYKSFQKAIKLLPESEQLKALWAIIDYGIDGKEPQEEGLYRIAYEMAKPQIDANNQRKTNGSRGGRPSKTNGYENEKPMVFENEEIEKPKEKVKEKVKDKEKDKENTLKGVKEKRFAPPTKAEVEEYCQEKGYGVNAERFIDFYESKGWYIGKNKMKNWRAAVRNWSRSQRQELTAEAGKRQGKAAAPNRFHNFEQGEVNYDSIAQRKLMQMMEAEDEDRL